MLALATSWPAYQRVIYDVVLHEPANLVAEIGAPSALPGAGGGLVQHLDSVDGAFAALSVYGVGQLGNQTDPRQVAAPLFAGFAGYFAWRVISYNNLFLAKEREANDSGRTSPDYPSLKLQRESYRDDRDLNIAYFLAVEMLGMIDAYVGAHLFDFDVGDNISSKLQVTPTGLGLSVRF